MIEFKKLTGRAEGVTADGKILSSEKFLLGNGQNREYATDLYVKITGRYLLVPAMEVADGKNQAGYPDSVMPVTQLFDGGAFVKIKLWNRGHAGAFINPGQPIARLIPLDQEQYDVREITESSTEHVPGGNKTTGSGTGKQTKRRGRPPGSKNKEKEVA